MNFKKQFIKMRDAVVLFVHDKTKTITIQLTIGISIIVFICTLMIGLIFLSQYRQLSLKRAEVELQEKSEQLAEIGNVMLTSYMPIPEGRLFDSLKGIADCDFWIMSADGTIVASTTDINKISEVDDINEAFINKINNNQSIITYDYSSYFGTKTLTAVTPIISGNHLIGAVMLHRNVDVIYSANIYYTILVLISLLISLFLSIILGTIYSRYFTKPIKRITAVAQEIAKQNYDVKTGINTEDEVGELARTIDTMSDEINKNIYEIKALEGRAKELVANVSHEFKTPLTLIRGYIENLKDKTTKPSDEVYDKIINNTIILEKLVNELLDLSKFQSGNVMLKKESLELKQLINDVVSEMRNIAKTKKIKIKIKDECDESQIIDADYIKIRQLLTIFVDNAIKYSNEKGFVEITILKNEIIIKDNGIGIEQNKLEQLFERYYQVDHNEKGYGLGLCIAKYIADAHNYKIVIDSKTGEGTSVHIIF